MSHAASAYAAPAMRQSTAYFDADNNANWFGAVLAHKATPCIVLSETLRIWFENCAAQSLLERCDGLRRVGDLLGVEDPRVRRAMCDAVRAVRQGPFDAQCDIIIDRPSGRAPLVAAISTAPRALSETDDDHFALVHLLDVDQAPSFERLCRRARAMFALTGAEMDVLARLLTEQSIGQIAAGRGTTIETVRSQVKSLLRKTSSHRHSELGRLRTLLADEI